jgi:hypothetical protein
MALKVSTALKRNMLLGVMGQIADLAAFNAKTLQNGVLRIYSGTQPATADAAATGTLLLQVTVSSGAFNHGSATNGLDFELSGTSLVKSTAEVWSGIGLATGTAGWFRFCGNPSDAGEVSTTLPRIDGRVANTGGELNLSNTSITTGAVTTVDAWSLAFPSTL